MELDDVFESRLVVPPSETIVGKLFGRLRASVLGNVLRNFLNAIRLGC